MQHYGTIVVVGGGCYGSYYVQQLARARQAGALGFSRLLVVDRDPDCRVSHVLRTPDGALRDLAPVTAIVARDWTGFFGDYLAHAAQTADCAADAIVPSPLMPHLMYEWLHARARQRWPDRPVRTVALGREPAIPWQRRAPDDTAYVSFAEWMCPINCIEPAMCPAIHGPRTWSLPPAVRAYVAAERARGRNLAGPVVVHCTHRAFGVGMFDTRDVVAGDRLVAQAGERVPVEVLIGTMSHCHGALNVLAIDAGPSAP